MGKTQEENLNLLKSMYLKLKHLGYRHTHINARTHTRKTQPRSQNTQMHRQCKQIWFKVHY